MSEKYLVICNAHPKEYDDYYIKLSGCDTTSSSAIYSNSVIRGLSLNNFDFDVISAASVGHYPFTSKTKKLKQIKYGNHFFGVGYNNNILISQLSKTKSIVKKYREISNDGSQGVLNIIVTDVHYPFLKAALKIRKKNKKTKIVLVCLDLPQYVKSSSKNPLLKFLKKISVNRVNKLSKKVDGYVFLSKYMEEIYGSKKRSVVSPCILDTSIYDGIQKASKETIDFVYCGVLSKQYNADFLLKAFSMLNSDNYRLILAGKGDVVEQINEMSKNDKRINYLGEVSREKAYFLQKNADVLVNPRLPNSEYTKLSFPSKTVSYLYSGNPLVCYSLPSFPDGLKNVIIEPKDIAPESFAEAMEFAIDKTNSKQIEEALKFSEKNVVNQIDKLFSEIRKNG